MTHRPHLSLDQAAAHHDHHRWSSIPRPHRAHRSGGHASVCDHGRAHHQARPLPRHRATRPGVARPAHRRARRTRWPRVLAAVLCVVVVLVCLLAAAPTSAAPPENRLTAQVLTAVQATTTVTDLETVVNNATAWLVGILAALATFFLTLGAIKYLTAGGDPSEVERAKGSFRNAAIGYGLAVLAPVILNALQDILGVSS
jgi:hypothetical protein